MSAKVALTLIDDDTSVVIGETEIESDVLPVSFLPETILHIGDDDYAVREAEPSERAEYEETGRLVLRLRRIDEVDPAKILFSLPTLCDALPKTEGPLLDGSELLLHEDDWRQIELVASNQNAVIDEELAEIFRVLHEERAEVGFRGIHVRKRPAEPLRGVALSLDELRQVLGEATESRVVLESSSHCVSDSFAFFADGEAVLYGTAGADRVTFLAVALRGEQNAAPRCLDALRRLAAKHELRLVDWCGCRAAAAGEEAFETILAG